VRARVGGSAHRFGRCGSSRRILRRGFRTPRFDASASRRLYTIDAPFISVEKRRASSRTRARRPLLPSKHRVGHGTRVLLGRAEGAIPKIVYGELASSGRVAKADSDDCVILEPVRSTSPEAFRPGATARSGEPPVHAMTRGGGGGGGDSSSYWTATGRTDVDAVDLTRRWCRPGASGWGRSGCVRGITDQYKGGREILTAMPTATPMTRSVPWRLERVINNRSFLSARGRPPCRRRPGLGGGRSTKE